MNMINFDEEYFTCYNTVLNIDGNSIEIGNIHCQNLPSVLDKVIKDYTLRGEGYITKPKITISYSYGEKE